MLRIRKLFLDMENKDPSDVFDEYFAPALNLEIWNVPVQYLI